MDAKPQPAPARKIWLRVGACGREEEASGRAWTLRRKRYVAKSSPFNTGAEACQRWWVVARGSPLFVQLVPPLNGGWRGGGERAERTRGDEMPLKSPRSRSSRVMVVSAWKVERYWTFGAGFWNRYFTFVVFFWYGADT